VKRLLLLLLVAGCGSQDQQQAGADGEPAAGSDAINLETGESERTPEQLQSRASEALRPILADPPSARLSNLRNGHAGAVCGHVDSKVDGRYAGARPFLVTPDGAALISPTPEIGFGDPSDVFPDFYIRWCASPEELERVQPQMTAPADTNAQMPEIPPPPAGAAQTPAPAPPTPQPSPPARETPKARQPVQRQPGDDSFMNAVLRDDDRP
jgi:hypothetical protein